MRFRVLLACTAIMLLCLFRGESADAAKHCYAEGDVSVLNGKGKVVGTIAQGTTFVYGKERSGYIRFKYYGKTRYASTVNLVTNKKLKDFIRHNPDLFSRRLSAVKGGKVFSTVSTRSKAIQKYSKGEKFNVFGETSDWYKVQVDGEFGYVQKAKMKKYCYVDVTAFYKPEGNSRRQRIVNFAKKFVGNPYVWGGTSLTSGCDCSGFTMSVMKNFGVTLPRCSYQQAEVGKLVTRSTIKPGDLIFYKHGSRVGHVVMYIGNGYSVEAKGKAYGIVISKTNFDSAYCMRNVLD